MLVVRYGETLPIKSGCWRRKEWLAANFAYQWVIYQNDKVFLFFVRFESISDFCKLSHSTAKRLFACLPAHLVAIRQKLLLGVRSLPVTLSYRGTT